MNDDPRCCGTGTCIINEEGYRWCGQKWDGQKMCFPEKPVQASAGTAPDFAQSGKTPVPGGERDR